MDTPAAIRYDIVGINFYHDRNPIYENGRWVERTLNYARADAESMAAVLEQSDALNVDRSHAYLHTDARATSEAVRRSLARLFAPGQNLPPNSIALFYFAGHGLVDPIEGTHILLGCHDVDMKNPKSGGISLNEVYDWLQGSSAACSIAIIDACFSGGIDDAARRVTATPLELASRAFGSLYGKGNKSYVIFASCQANQQARESEEYKHGVFTQELLTGWRDGAARDSQGVVYINGLIGYLSQRFKDHQQKPVLINHRDHPIPLGRHPGLVSLASTGGVQVSEQLEQKRTLTQSSSNFVFQRAAQKPSRSLREQLKGLAKPIGITAALLVVSGLLIWLVPPLQGSFFAVIFGLAILIIPGGMLLRKARLLGIPLGLLLLIFLPCYGYDYFHWGTGISLLELIANWEWVFWVALFIDIIVLSLAMLDRS